MNLDDSPLFVGGVGGSGTRVVCSMAIDAGYFMGGNLNDSLDSLDFQPFYDDNIRKYLEQKHSLDFQTELKQIFLECVLKNNAHINSPNWGAKNPRFILVLPFLFSLYPNMKFIHVIRDGRDMAFSTNQNQPRLYGDIFVKDLLPTDPLFNLRYWCIVNQSALEYCESNLRDNYFRVRYEDILEKSEETTKKIYEFLDSSITDYSKTLSNIKPPTTVGRWKLHQEKFSKMTQYEKNILEKFGYF